MGPPLGRLDAIIKHSKKPYNIAIREAFDHIYNIMTESKPEIGEILQKRKDKGEIKDTAQAIKSIAGGMFQNIIIYLFYKNKEAGNIPANILVVSKKEIKMFGEDLNIVVDGESQKPDCDLLIYNNDTKKVLILSLKTSLRERVGQTYKWKLLLEIANSEDEKLKAKYKISYKGKEMPVICFATVNFYNEINQPQQRGMLKFFDKAFIAKPHIKDDFISKLSDLSDFVKSTLG